MVASYSALEKAKIKMCKYFKNTTKISKEILLGIQTLVLIFLFDCLCLRTFHQNSQDKSLGKDLWRWYYGNHSSNSHYNRSYMEYFHKSFQWAQKQDLVSG